MISVEIISILEEGHDDVYRLSSTEAKCGGRHPFLALIQELSEHDLAARANDRITGDISVGFLGNLGVPRPKSVVVRETDDCHPHGSQLNP